MAQKILVLIRDKEVGEFIQSRLSQSGAEVVGLIYNPTDVHLRGLSKLYNIIVVDKWFCATTRHTTRFIIDIRKGGFWHPMLGIEFSAGDGDLSHLQVAGCNFILRLGGFVESAASEQIISACSEISQKLENMLTELLFINR